MPAADQPQPHNPAISVLIPVYNVERYLGECLDSLLAQSFTDFEAILLNDGSTDGSSAICHTYARQDARFIVVDKANSGYGATLNLGLDMARGTYIAILESDDFFTPDALELLHDAAETHGAQIAKGNCYKYWSRPFGRRLKHLLVPPGQTGRPVNPRQEHDIFLFSPSVWSALYRRDFLNDHDIRFLPTPGASYQDTSFSFKLWASATRVVFLPNALICYRQDNESSSVNSPAKVNCVVDEFAEIERYLNNRAAPDWMYQLMARLKYEAYLWNYERLGDDLQLDFLYLLAKDASGEKDEGRLNVGSLDDWQQADLEVILRSPDEYHALRNKAGQHSSLGRMKHYLTLGGPKLLTNFIQTKVFHR